MRVAICDDQSSARERLVQLLERYQNEHRIEIIADTFCSAGMLFDKLDEGTCYDVIFMDIEMADVNGLEAIRHIKEHYMPCLFVIVSAYEKYAIHAIELEVFRYLIKETLDASFFQCMDAVVKRIESNQEEVYYFVSERKKIKVMCRSIIYCYKDKKMSVLVTENGEIRLRITLQRLLADLCEICDYFVMSERGIIVNMHCIDRIRNRQIYLEDGRVLPLGASYADEVKRELDEFWRSRLSFH